MEESGLQSSGEDEERNKRLTSGGKIKHTVQSMKKCMVVTEDEEKYRRDNAPESDNYKKLRCTTCSAGFKRQIIQGNDVTVHPLLDILMCKSCCNFYGDGNFSLDSEGEDKYCRWCGKGGTLYSCAKCICAFCKKCIKKHFGDESLQKVIDDDDWICYFCNPKPLWDLRRICSLAKQMSADNKNGSCQIPGQLRKDKKKVTTDSDGSTSDSSRNTNVISQRTQKLRRGKETSYFEYSLSSSDEEKENNVRRRRLRRNRRKITEVEESEEDTVSPNLNPIKRRKLYRQSMEAKNFVQEDDKSTDEDTIMRSNKSLVVEKIKGIWKMIQVLTEIGLSWSKDQHKNLSEPGAVKTLEDLEVEYQKLKSVVSMLNTSVNRACETVENLKDDLTCTNVKDNRDVFQSEEVSIKRLAKKLLGEGSSTDSEPTSGRSEKEKKQKESPTDKEKTKGNNGTVNDKDLSVEECTTKEEEETSEIEADQRITLNQTQLCSRVSGGNGNHEKADVEGEKKLSPMVEIDVPTPMLKVKAFARMTDDNLFDTMKKNPGNSIGSNIVNAKEQVEEESLRKEASPLEETKESEDKKVKNDESKDEVEEKSDEPKQVNLRGRKNRASAQNKNVTNAFRELREKRKEKKNAKQSSSTSNAEKEEDGEQSGFNSAGETAKQSKQRKRKNLILSDDEDRSDEGEKENKSNSESDRDVQTETINSDSSSINKEKWKKRRKKRVKKNSESSSVFSDDSSNSNGSKRKKKTKAKNKTKGRRNIKRILKTGSLKLDTKEALKREEERKKRVDAKMKLLAEAFPEEFDAEGRPKQIVLDFDPETKQPLVSVHEDLVKLLKPHQARGVRFMWNNCFESVERLQEDGGSGCILAHCMGLGKTLQIITFVHTIMNHDLGVNTVLIVCPLNTVSNWLREFEEWLEDIDTEPFILYDLLKKQRYEDRVAYLKDWRDTGGVLVSSYDTFRNLTKPPSKGKKVTAKQSALMEILLDPGPDLVVCDEGHILRNENTSLSKCVNRVKTSRRIVLTGTPLQNNLLEYHCMVQFIKPNILGTRKEFSNRFVNPINNGQFEDSTDHDVRVMKRRSHVLHSLLEGCVQRCDYSVLSSFLPEKHEYVLSISLTDVQVDLYRHFLEHKSGKLEGSLRSSSSLFNDYQNLHRIWTHPRAMLMHHERQLEKLADESESEGSLKDFVVDTDEEEATSPSEESDDNQTPRNQPKRVLRSNVKDGDLYEKEKEKPSVNEWWSKYFKESDYDDLTCSQKMVVLFSLLKICGECGDKVLVFSQSLYSLDLIEHFLALVDEAKENDEKLCRFRDNWNLGLDYFRLDGTTNADLRKRWCDNFNDESNKRGRLFLISTRAGGLGINLQAANRVVVFDASWNPSNDLQSIFRVYRFGQKKICYIYRFLAEATMEEKIYKRQVSKLSLAHRVVDEHQIERHYSMMNLQELYSFDPTPPNLRKTPAVPKDKVLAELLITHKDAIVAYHEHESLLENQEEEHLTEEERKAAWKEFEEEKARSIATIEMAAGGTMDNLAVQNLLREMGVISQVVNGVQGFYLPTQLPAPLVDRGLAIGLVPFQGERPESYLTRVINRELIVQQNPRET